MLNIPQCFVHHAWVEWDSSGKGIITRSVRQTGNSFRAARLIDNPDRFLFIDFPRKSDANNLRDYLMEIIRDGVVLAGRRFTFFGITETGIKEGRIICFYEDSEWSVERVLKMCGNLEKVFIDYGPGKYAARLVLSFSSTIETLNVQDSETLEIPDTTADDDTLTTDGCGIIRESTAKVIRRQLRVDSTTTAFQIRRGGIKGLLVAYSDEDFDHICRKADPDCEPDRYELLYRRSMRKYDGGPTVIDVNRVSTAPHRSGAKLNYGLIVLLMTLGISIEPLECLLERQVQDISDISNNRQHALAYIKSDFDAQESGRSQELREMLLAGHDMTEPYLQYMIHKYQNMLYASLQRKFSISVSKACYVFGVVDELDVLKDNEVYVNLPSTVGILEGNILVARNPAYLPSDLRVLDAICCPRLAFIKNCIVFPRKGRTSIPNLMSGGDLDGDKYFVCWDQSIIPRGAQEPTPQDLKSPIAIDSTESSSSWADLRTAADIPRALVDTFVQLHGSKILSRAANEWQSVVKCSTGLASATYPRELARIIAVALDMMKTGADYRLLNIHFQKLKVRYRPSINEDNSSPLEVLRDQMREYINLIRSDFVGGRKFVSLSYRVDPDLVKIRDKHEADWNEHYTEGRNVIITFSQKLENTQPSGPEQETEYEDYNGIRDVPNDKVVREFRERYFQPKSKSDPKMLTLRASAWYCVGYESDNMAFAWLGASFLNCLKKDVKCGKGEEDHPSAQPRPNGKPGITSLGRLQSAVHARMKGVPASVFDSTFTPTPIEYIHSDPCAAHTLPHPSLSIKPFKLKRRTTRSSRRSFIATISSLLDKAIFLALVLLIFRAFNVKSLYVSVSLS
ncbi:RNA dependent RNA polymerase-domain-containing protein [Phellopilus nigrolimitatus]|nr:RNA dependent RNA polymerase-domain-containing protein [Phellopilus nigrolimitatus]